MSTVTGDFNGQWQAVRHQHHMDLSPHSHMASITWSGGGVLSHAHHVHTSLASLQSSSCLVDVSLISGSGGPALEAHKIVLASASPLLRQLFTDNDKKHSVVMLPQVSHRDLVNIVKFVYSGNIELPSYDVSGFLSAADTLHMEGIMVEDNMMPQDLSMKPPKKKLKLENEVTSPSRAHDSKPETFLQKTLATFPAAVQSLSAPATSSSSSSSSKGRHSSNPDKTSSHTKLPNWSQSQLQDAIESVITQKLRFTQASAKYGIPKGTLYDNILGKSKRMQVLEQVGLTESQELSVLEYCCEISSMPYNRRTSRALSDIIQYIIKMKQQEGKDDFVISMRQGFKWWWAFTKKHNIISLYYQEAEESAKVKEENRNTNSPPENLLNLINNPSSIPINIPTSTLLPFLGLNNHSKYSLKHPDYLLPNSSVI